MSPWGYCPFLIICLFRFVITSIRCIQLLLACQWHAIKACLHYKGVGTPKLALIGRCQSTVTDINTSVM